jgi:hypothetical protein
MEKRWGKGEIWTNGVPTLFLFRKKKTCAKRKRGKG